MRPELISRWLTPDGQRRRARLLELGLRGPWRGVLEGFPGSAELGDNRGDLRGIDLSQQELPGADLVRARLEGAKLEDTNLTEARLELATLSGASLAWASLDRAHLLACVALDTRWDDAALEDAVLTASNLTGGSFRRARMRGANLTSATLKRADLRVADLRGAEVRLCDFEDACIACVRRDRPRTYHLELARLGERQGFPTFRDALELPPGYHALRSLSWAAPLLHIEAALEASPAPDREILALLSEPWWPCQLVGAVALVLGGESPSALLVLWGLIERGTVIVSELVVVALLVDPGFERQATARLSGSLEGRVRVSLAWALEQLTGHAVPLPSIPESEQRGLRAGCQRWLERLRRHVEPRLRATWPLGLR